MAKQRSKEAKKRQQYNRMKRVIDFIRSRKEVCQICGEQRRECLDFHHISGKEFNLSAATRIKAGIKTVEAEIAKCIVVCANCHRVIHSRSA